MTLADQIARQSPSTQAVGNYVVISPCRDEAQYMRHTLDSMAAQTVRPSLWIIVDDGSTDDTPRILAEYTALHDWITVVRRDNRGKRSVGPGVIEAFYAGLDSIDLNQFDYLCKLDLDLEFPPRYFERLMQWMQDEPRLGTCSGKVFVRNDDGSLEHEVRGDENSVGPAKFYRAAAFRDIGGFARHVGWDGIDGHVCRMRGWMAASRHDPETNLVHLRRMGASDRNLLKGRIRGGEGLYYIGNSLMYVLARSIARLKEPPIVLGAGLTLYGYLRSMILRRDRFGDSAYRKSLHRFERQVLLHGKSKTLKQIHARLHADGDVPRAGRKASAS